MALVGLSGKVYSVGFLTRFCLTKMNKGLHSHLLMNCGFLCWQTHHLAYVFSVLWENILFTNFRSAVFPQPIVGFHTNGILENSTLVTQN